MTKKKRRKFEQNQTTPKFSFAEQQAEIKLARKMVKKISHELYQKGKILFAEALKIDPEDADA